MKSRWIIGFLITCVLAIPGSAQESSGAQPTEGAIVTLPKQDSGSPANPSAQLQVQDGQDAGIYPERLEAVLGAMSAELGEIGQALRDGRISRAQAEYLSLERYYVALTRFQLLRAMYQNAEESNHADSYSKANTAPQVSRNPVIVPPRTCSPDIPQQTVDYLGLTPAQIKSLQAQVTEQCQQVQPLLERLEKSRRKLIAAKLNGKVDDREIQALAVEQSRIIKQLIVANSQLEAKLYGMLTTEQQLKVDGLLRQTLDPGLKLPSPE